MNRNFWIVGSFVFFFVLAVFLNCFRLWEISMMDVQKF